LGYSQQKSAEYIFKITNLEALQALQDLQSTTDYTFRSVYKITLHTYDADREMEFPVEYISTDYQQMVL